MNAPKKFSTIPELPSLPRAALHIIQMVQDPNVDLQKLGKAVEMDPSLAMKLVRLSNSSLFGLSREVLSVHQALVILGLRTVKMAALSFTLLESFPKGREGDMLASIWKRILTNAMGCRLMATLFDVEAEEAFLSGMLQDIGMLLLAKQNGERYFQILEKAYSEEGGDLLTMERSELEIDHAQMGARLVEHWKLPATLGQTIAGHHQVDIAQSLAEGNLGIPPLLAVVESVTNFLLYPTMPNLEAFNAVSECFGETVSEVDKFVQRLEMQVEEMAELLNLSLPPGESFEAVLRRSRDLSENLRVLHREALPLRLGQELAMARRQGWALSLVLVRMRIELAAGHADDPQRRIDLQNRFAAALQELTRECDSIFRLGDDVLCLLAPNTPTEGLECMFDRLASGLPERCAGTGAEGQSALFSFGVCTVEPSEENVDGETVLRTAVENLSKSAPVGGVCVSTIGH